MTDFSLKNIKKEEVFFWLIISILIILKIYQGDQSFYVKHFNSLDSPIAWQNWHKWTYHFFATFFLFAVIPIILIKTVLKKPLSSYGVQLGDWRFGIKATLIAFAVMWIPVYFSSQNAEHMAFYPLTTLATKSPNFFLLWIICYLPHYIGWEFLFRGFIGFESKNKYGLVAGVMIPTLLTVLMHIGKPQGETWGALIAGIYLSLLTFRTRSILWALLFHWYMGIANSYFCG